MSESTAARLAILVLTWVIAATSPAQTPPARDLTQLSLEDLMNVQVTSVSKKEQKLAKTGAAVFVITQEDIRRSGATNIPDLLRMVPGVDVARADHNNWAVSIRGFNSVYANKVLVLIDGRSVYHPAFSVVLWFAQDVPLEDIERIEVIRGPGGTVWGANAMNGVINIITKSAENTPRAGGRICKARACCNMEAQPEPRATTVFLAGIRTKETQTLPTPTLPRTRGGWRKGVSARTGGFPLEMF